MRKLGNREVNGWLRTLLMVAVLLGSGQITEVRAEFGDVVMNQYSDAAGIRPVVFPHWFHRMRYSCKSCHSDLEIKFEAGGTGIDMVKIVDGQYCGACHNGVVAWSIEQCDLCHNGIAGMSTRVHESTIQGRIAPARPAGGANRGAGK